MPDDTNLKLHELADRQGGMTAKGKSADKVVGDMIKVSMKEPGGEQQKEAPMIKLKHRWMRNRNLVVGSTVVSFNQDGEAEVEDIANAKLDTDVLVRSSGGLVKYATDDPQEAPKPPAEKAAPAPPPEEKPAEKPAEEPKEATPESEPKKQAPEKASEEPSTEPEPKKQAPERKSPKRKSPPGKSR